MGVKRTTALSGPLSEYLWSLKDGLGLETASYGHEGAPRPHEAWVADVFAPEGDGWLDVENVRSRLRDALVAAAADPEFRATLQRRRGSTSQRTAEDVLLIGQVIWNLSTSPSGPSLALPAPRDGMRLPAYAARGPDIGTMARDRRFRYGDSRDARSPGRGCHPEVGGGDSLKENGKKLANRMAEFLTEHYPPTHPVSEPAAGPPIDAEPHPVDTVSGPITRPLPLLADYDDPDSVLQVLTVRDQTVAEPLLGSDRSGETPAAIGPSGDVVAALVDGTLISGWVGDDMRADAEFACRFDGPSLKILGVRSRSRSGIELALSDRSGTFLSVRESAGTWSEPVRIAGVGTLTIGVFLDEGFLGCEPNGRGLRGTSAAVLPSKIWKHFGTVTGMDVVVLDEYEGVALWGFDVKGEPVGMILTHLRARGSTWDPTVLPGALQVSLARREAVQGRSADGACKFIRFAVRNRDGSYAAEAGQLGDALARRGEVEVDA